MIKCSICSYQCDSWYVSNWGLACHNYFSWGRVCNGLALALLSVALAWHLARCSTPSGCTFCLQHDICMSKQLLSHVLLGCMLLGCLWLTACRNNDEFNIIVFDNFFSVRAKPKLLMYTTTNLKKTRFWQLFCRFEQNRNSWFCKPYGCPMVHESWNFNNFRHCFFRSNSKKWCKPNFGHHGGTIGLAKSRIPALF